MSDNLLIVALGNPLRGDDGVGDMVALRLRSLLGDGDGRIEMGGTDVLRALSLWRGEREVWLIDAVRRGDPPGTIHRVEHEALLAAPQHHEGAHALSLPECLRWLMLSGSEMAEVRFRLWGVEVDETSFRQGLSARVAASVEPLAAELAAAAQHLRCRAVA